jgi:hypothetical protein
MYSPRFFLCFSAMEDFISAMFD